MGSTAWIGGEVHDNDQQVAFSTKELLVEVRNDVRAINLKLDSKADRERVHALAADLAALQLKHTARSGELAQALVAVIDHGHRLDAVEGWRSTIIGGFAVATLFFGLASALFVWAITQ